MIRFAARAALAALFIVPFAGCSKKVSPVDPAYTVPEGTDVGEANRLVVWRDLPWPMEVWTDAAPEGRGPEDTIEGFLELHITGPGVIHGMVLDHTAASAYQVMRTESNGGVFPLEDYTLYPSRKWLDTQWEMYRFEDPTPSGYSPATYFGRGVVNGIVVPSVPLTDPARVVAGTPLVDIPLAGNPANNQGPGKDRYRFPPDSLFVIKWTQQVPGAVGYLVQVFQNGQALPSPLALDSRDYYVAWVPATSDSVKIRREDPGTEVLASRTIVATGQYFARVAAISADGELIGITHGDTLQSQTEPGRYFRFRAGAIELRPERRAAPQASVGPGAASVAPRLPRLP